MDEYHCREGVKKHTNNERTYKAVREFKPVNASFAILLMRFLSKRLYVQARGELMVGKRG